MSAQDWDWIEHLPTTIPCPTWCELEAGHPYTSEATAPELLRTHLIRRETAGLVWQLTQLEQAASPAGPIERQPIDSTLAVRAPRLWGTGSYDSDPISVTADQLHALGEHLADFAHIIDRVSTTDDDWAADATDERGNL
jgi:hypothetical protein